MRDLIFKNLTSAQKKRKIIATCEVADQQGIRSIIRRHFICMVREVKVLEPKSLLEPGTVHVVKERNTRVQTEKFFCKLKAQVYVSYEGKVFLVNFMHSLKIVLMAIPENLVQHSDQ